MTASTRRFALAGRVAIQTSGWGQIIETTPDAKKLCDCPRKSRNQPLLAKSLL